MDFKPIYFFFLSVRTLFCSWRNAELGLVKCEYEKVNEFFTLAIKNWANIIIFYLYVSEIGVSNETTVSIMQKSNCVHIVRLQLEYISAAHQCISQFVYLRTVMISPIYNFPLWSLQSWRIIFFDSVTLIVLCFSAQRVY